jgi:hypothetical protein
MLRRQASSAEIEKTVLDIGSYDIRVSPLTDFNFGIGRPSSQKELKLCFVCSKTRLDFEQNIEDIFCTGG